MTSLERIHLAQELHDGIAQDLVAIGYSLDLLLAEPDTAISVRKEIRTLRFAVTGLIEKVRDEMFDLRNAQLPTFTERVHDEARLLLARCAVELDLADCIWIEKDSRNEQLLKIVREILRNIVEHSKATRVQISMQCNQNSLHLFIQDNGIGGVSPSSYGMGLLGVFERACAIGAEIDCTSNTSGTSFSLKVSDER